MTYTSLAFFVFFPVVVITYYLIPIKYRYLWLLLASFCFYGTLGVKCTLTLLGIIVITYFSALLVSGDENKRKKPALVLSIAICLGILAVFKYAAFIVDNLNRVLNVFGTKGLSEDFSIIMPLGVSFYIFRAISYIVDVYKGKISAEKNFLKCALLIAFFPLITSGPIERSDSILKKINGTVLYDYAGVKYGLLLMLWGYFQKFAISDRLAVVVESIYSGYEAYSGSYILLATFLFSAQIYSDFCGYTCIAIGASKVLGYDISPNFRQPFFAVSIREHWRRWHISLSTWFRDYVYIPLGGNRKGKLRKAVNIMITFILSGLWHGSSWNYVAWGGVHGLFQVIEDFTDGLSANWFKTEGNRDERFSYKLFRILYTFCLVNFSWFFFRADSFRTSLQLIKKVFTDFRFYELFDGRIMELGLNEIQVRCILPFILIAFIVDVLHERGVKIVEWLDKQGTIFRWLVYSFTVIGVIIIAIQNVGQSGGSFLYYQF